MTTQPTIHVLQMYPREMNIYGDHGNTLTLTRRLQWRGFPVEVHDLEVGGPVPPQVDVVVGGGGQDSGQAAVYQDLLERKEWVAGLVAEDVPFLLVCGMYQLFGRKFDTIGGAELTGIGILDVTTRGQSTRMIGNVVADSPELGELVGFENHSGQTWLGDGVEPLATVRPGHGAGNNGTDGTEGARYANVIGTYLHGSVLPKNPVLADALLAAAVSHAGWGGPLAALDFPEVAPARRVAASRPR